MNKGSLRALPRRETRQSARIAAASTNEKTSDEVLPEVPRPLVEKRKRKANGSKNDVNTPPEPVENPPVVEQPEISKEVPSEDAQKIDHDTSLRDMDKTPANNINEKEENETFNEKRARAEDSDQSSDDDSDSDDDDHDSCVEMINTNKANETMLKVNCSLNANNNDDFFVLDESYNLNLLKENEIIYLKNLTCSPMIFSTKVLFKIFSIDELHGHNISGKTMNKNEKPKKPLEQTRLMYIKWLVDKYFQIKGKKSAGVWKRCCKAINRTIRISERKAANQKQNAGQQQKQPKKSNAKGDVVKNPTIITQIPPLANCTTVEKGAAVKQSS